MIDIRLAETDDDCNVIFEMLLRFGDEAAEAPVNPVKVAHVVDDIVKNHAAIIAMVDGEPAGTLGIVRCNWWYADDPHGFMMDQWLYVLPEHRGGGAMKAMLAEAARIADLAEMKLMIAITNENRRRGLRGELGVMANVLRYQPGGLVLAHEGET